MALSLIAPVDLYAQTRSSLCVTANASDDDVVAAAVRRAAGSLCPCPPRTLADAVASSLRGLVGADDLYGLAADVVDRLLVIGDLLELAVEDHAGGTRRRTVYAAPPAFCSVRPGHLVVIGLASEQPSALPRSVQDAVAPEGLVRRVADESGEHAAALRAVGFAELPYSLWLWAPEPEPSAHHVERFHRQLDAADPVTSEPDVEILDPERANDYYRGRWTPLTSRHEGRFVARRPRRYGADAWSFVDVEGGEVVRLIDLPLLDSTVPADVRPYCRACDQAWQLQAALDAERATPQSLRVHPDRDGTTILDLFAPPPAWLDRRWSALGHPTDRSRGALLSWTVSTADAPILVQDAIDRLWLTTTSPDA